MSKRMLILVGNGMAGVNVLEEILKQRRMNLKWSSLEVNLIQITIACNCRKLFVTLKFLSHKKRKSFKISALYVMIYFFITFAA